jgi:hypothetical protein
VDRDWCSAWQARLKKRSKSDVVPVEKHVELDTAKSKTAPANSGPEDTPVEEMKSDFMADLMMVGGLHARTTL